MGRIDDWINACRTVLRNSTQGPSTAGSPQWKLPGRTSVISGAAPDTIPAGATGRKSLGSLASEASVLRLASPRPPPGSRPLSPAPSKLTPSKVSGSTGLTSEASVSRVAPRVAAVASAASPAPSKATSSARARPRAASSPASPEVASTPGRVHDTIESPSASTVDVSSLEDQLARLRAALAHAEAELKSEQAHSEALSLEVTDAHHALVVELKRSSEALAHAAELESELQTLRSRANDEASSAEREQRRLMAAMQTAVSELDAAQGELARAHVSPTSVGDAAASHQHIAAPESAGAGQPVHVHVVVKEASASTAVPVAVAAVAATVAGVVGALLGAATRGGPPPAKPADGSKARKR